ncbi:LLM class flavin-dependent oxidoreductase [Actinacidiphila sp. bgisy145]|uniref:LLM class flavin-dependent oxidoreductase n=1 Tax=Actinacidiphila sp. bgisy145 TaxID=3413792 RepID=UPI003EBA3620
MGDQVTVDSKDDPTSTRGPRVAAARAALGPVGVVLPVSFTGQPAVSAQRAAVVQLEQAGYRTAWTNEVVGGKDALVHASILLGATRHLVLGTSIANIWARSPQTLHAAAAQLAEAYPGRFVLGVGVGYPDQAAAVGRAYGSPLATLRDHLGRMDAPTQPPAPEAPYPRIVAANGPRMLALAAELSDGALPAGMPEAYTAYARKVLGPDRLLAVGLSVVPGDDPEQTRAAARQMATALLSRPSYAAVAAKLGLPGAGADPAAPDDALVDALVAHGGPDAIAAAARRHLAAGADHVLLLPQPGEEYAAAVDTLAALAPALADLA